MRLFDNEITQGLCAPAGGRMIYARRLHVGSDADRLP